MESISIRIKTTLLKILDQIFLKGNYTLRTLTSVELMNKFYEYYRTSSETYESEITSLVFSKDRAMQVHTFLSSYFENISNYSKMIVLYKASDTDHQKSYKELENIFSEYPVTFIEEIKFREQLIEEVSKCNSKKILFYVDDMIFTHKFDYKTLHEIDPYKTIISLTRGSDMTYSSVLLKYLDMPKFKEMDNGMLAFDWNHIKGSSDWSYPLGVSGYMFAAKEYLAMIKTLSFKAPNSLEAAMQWYMPVFTNRKGICTKKAISVCVHANLVQTEGYNPVLGLFSIEELLEKWNNGYQIEYSKFYNKSMTITQEQNYTFVLR